MTIDEPYKGDWLSYIFSITYVDSLMFVNFQIPIFLRNLLTFLPDEMTSVEHWTAFCVLVRKN